MRFSAITAICAAPLALAGSLHADLVARGAVKAEEAVQLGTGKGAGNVVVNAAGSNAQITEIIIIWVNPGNNAATTTLNSAMSIATGAGGAVAAGATHKVTVGGPGLLTFQPESIAAAVGDMVEFSFLSVNHTVTQSAFDTPCNKLAGGMDSGFMPNPNGTDILTAPKMAMQVTVATPLWFYCRQKGHCGKGMVFSINASNSTKTAVEFKQLAVKSNGTGTTAVIVGGTPAPAASAAAPPPAATASVAAGAPTMAVGAGTVNSGGACSCQCLCGVAAFPNAAQGLGAFGGMSGAMPMAALEA